MNNANRYDRQREQHQQNHLGSFAAGIAIGAMIGSAVALLTAPQAGEKTRAELERELSHASNRLRHEAASGVDDGRHRAEHTINDLEREIKMLRDRIENR